VWSRSGGTGRRTREEGLRMISMRSRGTEKLMSMRQSDD